jgi:hypothetical protein
MATLKNEHWERLSLFESHDFVGSWYKKTHGRSLNSQKTKEITSCFTQGRQYFLSGANAEKSVRPLLLYYGVLALSRGTILLKSNDKSEANLKPSHGLETREWNETFAGGIGNVLELKLSATSGTFSEFVTVVDNFHDASVWSAASNMKLGSYRVVYAKPSFLSSGTTVSLDDLLSRDQRLNIIYQESTGKHPRCHPADIVLDGNTINIGFFAFSNGPGKEVFETCFKWPTGVKIEHRTTSCRLPVPNFLARIETNDWNKIKQHVPIWDYTGGDAFLVIQDFENGDRMSELYRTYLISYVLGMLVRYFPSRWVALLRNEKGDAAMPLLASAMGTVEIDFPKGIAKVLA